METTMYNPVELSQMHHNNVKAIRADKDVTYISPRWFLRVSNSGASLITPYMTKTEGEKEFSVRL